MSSGKLQWSVRAESMQENLYNHYWNDRTTIMNQWYPCSGSVADENFYYWWQAHVIDVLVDAWERSQNELYLDRINRLTRGLKSFNGSTFRHNYYDDMEWTALALLRVYDHTSDDWFKSEVLDLWSDIQTAWNDHMGGGMAWKKDQLDYKNTPANAPAAILAARLYARFGSEDDLAWAIRIYNWNRAHLVDPQTGFVWDGMNRMGDGQIDKDWKFTYCQGVFIGAGVELFACTGESTYLEDAAKTARAAKQQFVDPVTRMLPDEGIDDTGLFKGIFIRYLKLLMDKDEQVMGDWAEILRSNGETMWNSGMESSTGIIGPNWAQAPKGPVQLSVRLSGLMLAEALVGLESTRTAR
jgi:predicted alpha-1,6-mannanase (GH76 family)